MKESESFYALTPERVLEAVEQMGHRCTGRSLALNSYENRVYDVELEGSSQPFPRLVVKFYRPGRWTREQILEEHEFLQELGENQIPVVQPLKFSDETTLRQEPHSKLYFSLFKRVYGRPPYELNGEKHMALGKLLGEVHNVGEEHEAQHRIHLTPETYGLANLRFLLEGKWVPREFETRYRNAIEYICEMASPHFEEVGGIRIHGDCHAGNLLWTDEGPALMDFDDMVMGPEVQDFWLLVYGREAQDRKNLESFLEGYEQVRSFDRSQFSLVEALRALRFIHFSAWLARRWEDPAFPRAFPEFNSFKYWDQQTRDMEEQAELVREALGG